MNNWKLMKNKYQDGIWITEKNISALGEKLYNIRALSIFRNGKKFKKGLELWIHINQFSKKLL